MGNQTKQIQNRLLDIAKWFDGFCEENGLNYFMIGGTLLGAVRHKGFIPWDDDIDFGMPRKDYERFLSLTSGKTFNSFLVESYKNGNKDYIYTYAKVYDTSTTLIEDVSGKLKRGLFIDIFPIDGIGNTFDKSVKNYRPILNRVRFLSSRTCAIRKGRSFYKNAIIFISRLIPKRFINNLKLIKKIDDISKKIDYDTVNFVGTIVEGESYKYIVKKEYFKSSVSLDFEDTKFKAPIDYKGYLTDIFGDYMTPPPKDKQVSNHYYLYLSLNEGYLGDIKG